MQITKRIYSNLDLRNEKLKNYGGVVTTIEITGTTTIDFKVSDEFLGLDISATGITVTVNLPSEEDLFEGKRIEITDMGGKAYSSNIIINGSGTEINGENSAIINTDYGSIILRYINENYGWRVIGFVN